MIDSDGFFDLEVQPKKVGVIGAGYIAVELAGVFNGLGTDTTLFVRKETALRNFDSMLTAHLDKNLKHAGRCAANYVCIICWDKCSLLTLMSTVTALHQANRDIGVNVMSGSIIKEVTKDADGTMTVHLENGKVM